MSIVEEVKALKNGRGVQYLINSARAIFKNPIYAVDSYYNLIAASEGPMEDFAWNEIVTIGTFSLRQREYLAKAGIFDIIANAKKTTYIEKTENLNYSSMVGYILNYEKMSVGLITMHEYYGSFEAEALEAYDKLAEKISVEIRDYEYFMKLPQIFMEETVKKLLDRTAKNVLIHHSQATILRQKCERYLYVAVVKLERSCILENVHRSRLEYTISLLKTRYKSHRAAIYEDHVVILMSSDRDDIQEALPLEQNNNFLGYNNLHMGISGSFEDIYEFDRHYDQAIAALKTGLKAGSGRRIFLCKSGPG